MADRSPTSIVKAESLVRVVSIEKAQSLVSIAEGSESGEGGEESGTQFALDDTFDEVRAGARLVLSYDSTANAFKGTVENTTEDHAEQGQSRSPPL